MTDQELFSEWSALASVPTLAGVLGHYVADVAPVSTAELPVWLQKLSLPAGWLLAQFDSGVTQPVRMAVRGPRPDGGWDGCETISLSRFTGTPPERLAWDTANRMLRDLGGESITTCPLSVPPDGKVTAVRTSGEFAAGGQRIWTQYSTYLVGSESPGGGLLVEHSIFVLSARQASLRDDIAELSNGIHDALVGTIKTAERNSHTADCVSVGGLPPPKGARITTFRVGFFPDFYYGDPVVLVGADREGMRIFQSAVRSAHADGESAFEIHGVQHRLVRQDGAADVEFEWQTIVWRFDNVKLLEILELIPSLIDEEIPGGHQYVDYMHSPAKTLILSVDEYLDGGPFAEFPQGLPVHH